MRTFAAIHLSVIGRKKGSGLFVRSKGALLPDGKTGHRDDVSPKNGIFFAITTGFGSEDPVTMGPIALGEGLGGGELFMLEPSSTFTFHTREPFV